MKDVDLEPLVAQEFNQSFTKRSFVQMSGNVSQELDASPALWVHFFAILARKRVNLDNARLLTLDTVKLNPQGSRLVIDPLFQVTTVEMLAGDPLRRPLELADFHGSHAGADRVGSLGLLLLADPALVGPPIGKLVVKHARRRGQVRIFLEGFQAQAGRQLSVLEPLPGQPGQLKPFRALPRPEGFPTADQPASLDPCGRRAIAHRPTVVVGQVGDLRLLQER